MRIIINARLLHDHRLEGIGRYAVEIIRRWADAHPEDEYHLIYDRPPKGRHVEGHNVKHHICGIPSRTPLLWKLWFEYFFYKKIQRLRPDIIFSPESYMCLHADIPTVITTHDIAYARFPKYNKSSHNNYYQKYFSRYHERAAHIITVSKFSRAEIMDYYSIDSTRITSVYNGVSKEFFPIENKSTGRTPYFLYIGSIHPRKNVTRLVLAYEKLRENGYPHQLILASRWAWSYNETKHIIQRSIYKNDIIVVDYKEDLNELINGATALCYLSLYEGFGLPPVEAMAAGCPVIASNVSAIPEVCGEAALLVDPTHPDNIYNAMKAVIDKPDLTRQMTRKGLQRVKQFSWDSSAQRIYQILKSNAHHKP